MDDTITMHVDRVKQSTHQTRFLSLRGETVFIWNLAIQRSSRSKRIGKWNGQVDDFINATASWERSRYKRIYASLGQGSTSTFFFTYSSLAILAISKFLEQILVEYAEKKYLLD